MDISKDQQYLIAELSHQINSPLAAIRNAVYLACCQTEDPLLQRYLRIADEEITVIATILRATRAIIEERGANRIRPSPRWPQAGERRRPNPIPDARAGFRPGSPSEGAGPLPFSRSRLQPRFAISTCTISVASWYVPGIA